MFLEAVLYIVLGFLLAFFLALVFLPVLWKRAVSLTERKVKSRLPQSLDEMEAKKDALRAEHAMKIRRMEMSVNDLRAAASKHLTKLHAQRDEHNRLRTQAKADAKSIMALQEERNDLQQKLETVLQTTETLSEKLKESNGLYEALQLEFLAVSEKNTVLEAELDKTAIDLAANGSLFANMTDDPYSETGASPASGEVANGSAQKDKYKDRIADLNDDLDEKNTKIVALQAELVRKTIDEDVARSPDPQTKAEMAALNQKTGEIISGITGFMQEDNAETRQAAKSDTRDRIKALGDEVLENAKQASNRLKNTAKPDTANTKPDEIAGDQKEMPEKIDRLMSRIREIQSELKTND